MTLKYESALLIAIPANQLKSNRGSTIRDKYLRMSRRFENSECGVNKKSSRFCCNKKVNCMID